MLGSMRPLPLLTALTLAACTTLPDTVGEAAPDGTVFHLAEVNDRAADFDATLRLFTSGRIEGTGPCNRFSAEQTAPLPWLQIEEIAATRRACDALEQEDAYFALLRRMDFSEVSGPSLLLTNSAGESLFYRAR